MARLNARIPEPAQDDVITEPAMFSKALSMTWPGQTQIMTI
jgi:hypothetical protein